MGGREGRLFKLEWTQWAPDTMNSVNEIKITYRNKIMSRAVNRLSTRGGKGGGECIRHTRHFPQVIRLEI